MPFKLKLKKTRQYNVASKNLFVISVELLDGGIADCTLSVDSTGQECLDNVCQRQAINQPEFFGLRYVNHNQQYRWVELNLPLKRQLDKHASSHQLHLRVMYYVTSGTSLITDEVTRNHYFLQLKNDLVEGRIVCDFQQAVVLASYSRQAEYGNHDQERHTVDYLKNLLTFPKQIIDGGQLIDGGTLAETGRLEWLTSAVIQHHMALHNMSQAQAEDGFISVCQLLRYYGQEMFSAHDQLKQTPLTIAVSLTGITLLTETEETRHFYRWQDITNVINHKKTFSIECQSPSESATFVLGTPDDGKYVWRMCINQHTFYMRLQRALSEMGHTDEPQPKFQEHGLSESREELEAAGEGAPLSAAHRAYSTSCLELAEPPPQHAHRVRALLPSYRPAPDYETAMQQKYQQQKAEAQAARFQTHHTHQMTNKPLVYGSHPDIHRVHYPDVTRHTLSVNRVVADDYNYGLKFLGHNNYAPFAVNPNVQTELKPPLHYLHVYKPPPPYPSNGLASNSTPDLAVASQALNYHRGYIGSHVSGSSPDLVSTRTALNRQYLGYINENPHNATNYNRPVHPAAHGTYNNLTSVLDAANPRIVIDSHRISDGVPKIHDDRAAPYNPHRPPYRRPAAPRPPAAADDEPIYENIPLPWRSDRHQIRNRARSLTTTDEMARPNERNGGHPSSRHEAEPPAGQGSGGGGHYVNAHVVRGASAGAAEGDDRLENIALAVDRMSLSRGDDRNEYVDETPYQSLSAHRANSYERSNDNVTSISVPDVDRDAAVDRARPNPNDGGLTNSSLVNSGRGSGVESETSANTTKNSSAGSKEKKRRRWGMFIGRGNKNGDVKSATLGRDRKDAAAGHPANRHRWSTGLPKSQPLPPSITKETLCQLLERKMSDAQLSFAFEQIPKARGEASGASAALLAAAAAYTAHGAVDADHLPYDDNRVRLPPAPHDRTGYINASHVTMTVGNSQRFYVIAAVPPGGAGGAGAGGAGGAGGAVEHAALLWECAWQTGARVVALVAGDDPPPHLPDAGATAHYGKMSVSTETRCVARWGVTSAVRVRCGAGAGRVLYHVHFTRWPRHRPVPADTELFLGFLSELGGLRLACAAGAGAGHAPLLVCCRAGAGRSGTALAADLLLHTLDHNQEIDIPRAVGLLHQQRANMIQNVHQYKFLHQILLQYLKQSRLI